MSHSQFRRITHFYWDVHGLIFETIMWLLAGSTRFVHHHWSKQGGSLWKGSRESNFFHPRASLLSPPLSAHRLRRQLLPEPLAPEPLSPEPLSAEKKLPPPGNMTKLWNNSNYFLPHSPCPPRWPEETVAQSNEVSGARAAGAMCICIYVNTNNLSLSLYIYIYVYIHMHICIHTVYIHRCGRRGGAGGPL